MTAKKLVGMGYVLLLLVAIAVVQHYRTQSLHSAQKPQRGKMFDGLDLNTVTAIDIATSTNTVSLVKTDGEWKVESLFGYPADFERLKNRIRAVANVDLGHPVRTGNLDDSEYGFGSGAKYIVLKAGETLAAKIEVGARRQGSGSGYIAQFFIRIDDAPEIYQVNYEFDAFPDVSADWINPRLINVPSASVASIRTGNVDLSLVDGEWELAGLDPETEELDVAAVGALRSALLGLSCIGVADPALSDAELGFDSAFEVSLETTAGVAYRISLGAETDRGDRYARVAVDSTAQTVAAPEEVSGWTYIVAQDDAAQLMVDRARLVREKASL